MYQPIEDYGLIGNMRTAALVGENGSIDWLCLPHFDSPSVFAGILDENRGGLFRIWPRIPESHSKQFYWPETNVLITRFLCADGVVEVADFMVISDEARRPDNHLLFRIATGLSGEVPMQILCQPSFDYGRDSHETSIPSHGACFHSSTQSLGIATATPLRQEGSAVTGDFTLREGQRAIFVLQGIERGQGCSLPFSPAQAQECFDGTVRYWRRWISRCSYTGRWRKMVHRSALVLKLLTFEPTGAIVAAPTCSLPEVMGGGRNWDYRYVWIRDAAFTVYALMRIGFHDETTRFMQWIADRCREANPDGSLRLMYGLDGRNDMPEHVLDHLEGYRRSGPVRIGNAAHEQLQTDIYGELMDSVYLYNKYGTPISYDLWQSLQKSLDWVCDNWHRPDHGIWEFRMTPEHFVYSKVMSWVALDRGLRLAEKRSFPADSKRWREARDTIYKEIHEKGRDAGRNAFVQAYGRTSLDAANLIMPLVFFASPTDPRMLSTIDAIRSSVQQGGLTAGGLVYRYNTQNGADGLDGEEGTFNNICSFWLIEALTRAGRTDPARLDDARLMFERIMSHSNHLGLFAEQIGPCGEPLGHFPQAFTHIALISAAYNLNRSLDQR